MCLGPFLPLHTFRHDQHAVPPSRVTMVVSSFLRTRSSLVNYRRPILYTFNIQILSQPSRSSHDQPFDYINDIGPKVSQSDARISTVEHVPVGHRILLEIVTVRHRDLSTGHEQSPFSIVYDHSSREVGFIVREENEKYQLK